MSSASTPTPLGAPTLDLSGRTILLATDGSAGALAGAHVALALATTYRAVVHVVSVVDTRSAPIPPPLDMALAMGDELIGGAIHKEQVEEVQSALSAATGQPIDWPVRMMLGTPASAIAREARRISASLVIVGLRRHGRLNRAMNDETALNVMRNAPCPVLGVVPGTTRLPVRVLAAVDFSEGSFIAARTARAVMGENAHLVLAYVPPLSTLLPGDGERFIHDLGVDAAFARTVSDLGSDGITFDQVVLHHELPRTPAEMILEYADSAQCDLIAAGSAHHSRLDRWMVGSVSTDLVRDGSRSVLIVPPQRPPRD